jgi:hypothetical protein
MMTMIISLTTDASFVLKNVFGTRCVLKPAAQFQGHNSFCNHLLQLSRHLHISVARRVIIKVDKKTLEYVTPGIPKYIIILILF